MKHQLAKLLGISSVKGEALSKFWLPIFLLVLVFSFTLNGCTEGTRVAYLNFKENVLREQFFENVETLIKLEKMQREDIKVYRIAPDWNQLIPEPNEGGFPINTGLNNERWNEYRGLFRKAGIDLGLQFNYTKSNRSVEFMIGDSYGYFYEEQPPAKTFSSFKECIEAKYKDACYIYLQKNWYIYLQ